MDLLSSTLDKYLRHRFNSNNNPNLKSNQTPADEVTQIKTNGISECRMPNIYHVPIKNVKPCCVAFRDDLAFLAAGFESSSIYLWTLNTNRNEPSGEQLLEVVGTAHELLAHSGPVYCVEFIRNNDLMLSCSEDTTIRLWCLNSKCNLIVYRGHNYPVWSINIGPKGTSFVSASMDATARLWSLDRITPVRLFCGHDDDVECVRFHPNEKYVATGSADTTVRLWSVSDGKMVRLMVGHQNPIISLSFLPDGKFLASASTEGVIKLWNLATNLVTNEFLIPASLSISFSPDQKFIASCGLDNIFRLWQLDQTNAIEKKTLNLNNRSANLILSHFHRDNKLFVVQSTIPATTTQSNPTEEQTQQD